MVAPPVAPRRRPAAPPVPSTPSTSQPVTELGFNTCQKIPRGKRVVKLNLKPEVELPELVAWISSVTCKSFVLPGNLSAGGKKITFVTQGAMTRDEAYAAFLERLDSIGLTVERRAGYYKIIESSKAKMSSMPVYGFDGKPTRGSSSGLGRLTGPAAHDFRAFRGASRHLAAVVRRACARLAVAVASCGGLAWSVGARARRR